MKEIQDEIKDKIREYSIKYPMYYDLLVYVLELERKLKEMENKNG